VLIDLTTIKRRPILIGFESSTVNPFRQLRGNFSVRPPKSATNPRDALREPHTTSS
jgi:hypothetical protein